MLFRKLLILFFFFFSFTAIRAIAFSEISAAQVSLGDKVKLIKAKNRLRYNDSKTAYNILYEVYKKNDKEPNVNYLLGQCLIVSEDYKLAVKHLEIALQSFSNAPNKLHLFLGIAYHRSGMLANAVQEFDSYKKAVSASKAIQGDVDKYLAQCNMALEQMKLPQKVEILNLGAGVNSKYPDYSPSITADGKTLIFTSRRPDTKGKKVDENDFMFYEDIYMARLNDSTKQWSAATNEGLLNTKFHDANLSISANGKQILVYRNVPGETKSGDIYYSDLTNSGKWSDPKPFGSAINTTYFESSACLTPDGKTLYFVSERKGGLGRGDIYMSQKNAENEWIEAKNLGNVINTEGDEISLFLHPDGKTLYFSSDAREGLGGYDIYKTVNENGSWSQPENLAYPINTVGDDLYFTIASNNVAYYVSDQENSLGAEDIYQVKFIKMPEEASVKKEYQETSVQKACFFTIANNNSKVVLTDEIKFTEPQLLEEINQADQEQMLNAPKQASSPVVEKKKLPISNSTIFETKYIPFETKNSNLKLTEQQQAELNLIAEYLIANPNAKLQVSGNTIGDSFYKLLSQNRSWNVADYFRQQGVSYSNVLILGTEKSLDKIAIKVIQ